MLRVSPVAVEIRNALLTKSASCDDALSRACADIDWRELRIRQLEAENERLWRLVSGGYARLKPSHPARALDPEPPSITDDWMATGAEAKASTPEGHVRG